MLSSSPHIGIAIPGLAMAANEIPDLSGLIRLENPEIGDGVVLGAPYSLEDVAALHAETVGRIDLSRAASVTVVGMSMGAMITSVLATRHRSVFPERTRFVFLVAPASCPEAPALPNRLLRKWSKVRSGDPASYWAAFDTLFSESFRKSSGDVVDAFFRYRSGKGNRQGYKAFARQAGAVSAFDGEKHYSAVNPSEAVLVTGGEDYITGPEHLTHIERWIPGAKQLRFPSLGHMAHLEAPELFDPRYWSRLLHPAAGAGDVGVEGQPVLPRLGEVGLNRVGMGALSLGVVEK